MDLQRLFQELKRRNVFRVATAYAIAGWLIIQICATTFPFLNLPEWLITAVIVFVLIGFPLSLIFAWAFELTPEGLKKSEEVDITESVTSTTGKKLNGIIIGVLSVALFFVLVERIFFAKASILEDSEQTAIVETASIAVLPFVNMSSDTENEYFSDGLSEELLNALAKVEDMQVAGRTSSFKFKGQNENLIEIGAELGVANILEGSVRKSGNRLRITAQLIRVSDGFHMWSETYDREFTVDNIFDIQEEISRHVMEELKVRLLPEEEVQLGERPTQDIEAYNAYLAATQVGATRRAADLEKAIELYQQAIRIDPTYAEAYAKLAFTYRLLHEFGDLPLEEMKELMKENIDKAMSLNENLASAYHAQVNLDGINFNRENALKNARKAYALAPNDATIVNSLYIQLGNDELEEKFRMLKKAYRLDPLSSPIATNYSNYLIQQENKFEEASKILDGIIARYPDYAPAYEKKAWLLRDTPYGELDTAFEFAYEAYQKNPEGINLMFLVSDIARDVDLIPITYEMADRMIELYPNNNAGFRNKLQSHLYEGDFEKVEEILSQFKELYGEEVKRFFIAQESYIAYQREEYEKGLEIFEYGYEDFFAEPTQIENGVQEGRVRFYVIFLDKLGRTEEAQEWRDQVNSYMTNEISSMSDEEEYNKLDKQIDLHLINSDFEALAETLEKLHFEFNSKANWPGIFQTEIVFFPFKESEYYQPLRNKIDADLAEMRTNIIEYLKAEGEWKEEWEEN
ncbi:MAG: tetratricopeptide repeat protein [Balneolaceae bacterium]|nr:tetratricopeptide repeat protein [Balneolaceae bacterium]MBO6545358.1 tetratricopeptide repeat protein [Balneolaceae bacterium]MBO6646754.1 tetratricopeptide repeat protein [Balneolaceae bacterium]